MDWLHVALVLACLVLAALAWHWRDVAEQRRGEVTRAQLDRDVMRVERDVWRSKHAALTAKVAEAARKRETA